MSYSILGSGAVSLNGAAPILLSNTEDASFKTKVIDRWSSLASQFSSKYGVPLAWILSIIYAESNGNPSAINHEPSGATGVGLMQITDPGLKRGLSDAQVAVPSTNLDIGVSFVRRIMDLGNRDLVRVASYFNCGGRADGSPHTAPTSGQNPAWGYCATAGYLERVTSANNTFILKYQPKPTSNTLVSFGKVAAGATLLYFAGRALFR